MKYKLVQLCVVALLGYGHAGLYAQTVTDIEGNVYKTVTIGTQTWMSENLTTTKYNDGTAIPLVSDDAAWTARDSMAIITQAYYWYDNDSTYNKTSGALYNGYTIITGKLCPLSWHVPSDAEWTLLSAHLGGEDDAGGKLKETDTTYWESPNVGATNEAGFNALPGGYRSMNGKFHLVKGNASWWSSTDGSPEGLWFRAIHNVTSLMIKGVLDKPNGISVRCIQD